MIYLIDQNKKCLVLDQNLQPMKPFNDYRHNAVMYLMDTVSMPLVVQFDNINDPPDDEEHDVKHILDHLGTNKVNWFSFEPVHVLPKDEIDFMRKYLGRLDNHYCSEYEFAYSLGIDFEFFVPNKGLEKYFDHMSYIDTYLWHESTQIILPEIDKTFWKTFFCPNNADKIHRRLLAKHLIRYHKDESLVTYGNWQDYPMVDQELLEAAYKNSFCTVVTETLYNKQYANFSEKTIDPMANYRPFVLAAPPFTLRLMKQLGFKTFDAWWDESYDREQDDKKRIRKLKNTLDFIASMSYNDKQLVLVEMEEVLQHNRLHIKNLEKVFYDIYCK